MNTAPINTALSDTGIAGMPITIGGMTLPAGSTSAQRLEAHAKAGTQTHFHVNSTAMSFAKADGTFGGRAAPPSPKALEAANKPTAQQQAAKLADFDAEMRASGKQITPGTGAPAPGEIDQDGLNLVTARYKVLAKAAVGDPAMLEQHKRAYHNDLKAFYDGRRLTDAQRARMRGGEAPGSFVPKAPAAPTPPAQSGWQSHVKDGQVDLEHLTTDDTHGFTIPRFVKDQTLHVAAFEQLKNAKAAGFTQEQVNAYLTTEARNKGWVKA